MSVDVTRIEDVLGPLRGRSSFDQRMIPLQSMGSLQWTGTWTAPVSEWLGNVDDISSHAETLQRMRVAAFAAFMDRVPVLADEHPWCLLDHQAAGNACRHVRFVGRRILLKPEMEIEFLDIAKSSYDSQLGRGDLECLTELVRYRSQLQEIGLDCNSSGTFKYLMEGLYPIDLSQSVMDQVCLQPFSLESLLGNPRPYGSIEHYAILAVIAPNSD
jgi:hypothetical protein